MIPKDATQYRIENIRTVTYNGKKCKIFQAYEKRNGALGGHEFVFIGTYKAPARTANKNLWLIANESDTTGMDE